MLKSLITGYGAWLLCMTVLPSSLFARECKSKLGVYLKPVPFVSGLSWSIEAVGSLGVVNGTERDLTVRTGMLLFALDYQFAQGSPHQLYLEGGLKRWSRTERGPGSLTDGLGWRGYPSIDKGPRPWRQAFYKFDDGKTAFTAGLQEMNMGGSFLLDERVLGVSISRMAGPFKIDLYTGTVSKYFARMGDYCALWHTYAFLQGGRFNLVSDNLWESNLAGAVLSWKPSPGSDAKDPESEEISVEEEGNSDEEEFVFEEVGDEEFGLLDEPSGGFLSEASLFFLEEFGSHFHEYKYYYGAMAELRLPAAFLMDVEVVSQHILDDKALAYNLAIKRDLAWSSGGLTDFKLGYIGKMALDESARFYPTFSNLFLGETARLDAVDMPLFYGSVKHTIPWKLKPSLRAFALKQTGGERTSELDLELGIRLTRGLRAFWIFSRVSTEKLDETAYVNRVKFRWAF